MASKKGEKAKAAAYTHDEEKRLNNPEAGLIDVAAKGDLKVRETTYCWDPRESPQLVWAGKAGLKKVEVEEQTSIEVPLVNLHIHERVSAEAIIRSVRRQDAQRSLFADVDLGGGKDFQFYQHSVDWANRMILGDSLIVMNSLLEREGMRGKVQCIFMDPPYGIKFGSNFQPKIDQRDVKDGKDEDLTREVMQVQAFRDTWELGIHSYLTYLRDRLLVAKELLSESGSIFVQIGDENVHRVRCLLDEVFEPQNFISSINFATTTGFSGDTLSNVCDHILWYAKSKLTIKYRELFREKVAGEDGASKYRPLSTIGSLARSSMSHDRLGTSADLTSQGASGAEDRFSFQGRTWKPGPGLHWKTTLSGLENLARAGRLMVEGDSIRYLRLFDDFPVFPLTNLWTDVGGVQSRTDPKVYAVQTAKEAIMRCVLMSSDPGDLILDPTCGSGSTAMVAEQWGRRWITIDTSRVALAIARHRLMTASFDWYRFRHVSSGLAGGFKYKSVPHITLKSIAQNQEIDTIAGEFRPRIDEQLNKINAFRPDKAWNEWEVPSATYDAESREAGEIPEFFAALDKFWELKREMQKRIDASIQRNAPQEELVDQPEKEPGIVRVSGPFTMEAVPNVNAEVSATVETYSLEGTEDAPPLGITLFEPGQPGLSTSEVRNVSAYLSDMIEKLRRSGVETRNKHRLSFDSLRPLDHPILHAEGEIVNGQSRRAAVVFGPQNGSISEAHVREAIRSSRKYDVLLLCGYDFTAAAQEMAQSNSDGEFQILLAYVAPDTVMGDLLKDTKASQLFTMVGEPDVVIYRHGDPDLAGLLADARRRAGLEPGKSVENPKSKIHDQAAYEVLKRAETLAEGEMFIELRGVDVYDPVSGEVRADAGANVHAIFIDHDYDGKSFCICQALFPNKKDSWDKIARNLKGSIDEDAFEAFRTLVSLPFKPGSSYLGNEGRVQVKVIDTRGNAVVKTVRV